MPREPSPFFVTATISSPRNERIREIRKLHEASARKRARKTILEGPNLIEAATSAGVVPEVLCVSEAGEVHSFQERLPAERILTVTPDVLASVAATEHPRGPVAVVAVPRPKPLQPVPTVVLWEIADPGNCGTLIRTAAALGWNVANKGGVDPWSPKVMRAAAGGHFSTRLSALGVEPLDALRDAGLSPVALVVSGGSPLADPASVATAILVGNEAHGLGPAIVSGCDAALSLPIRNGVESLNASAAGAIAMWVLGDRD